MKRINKAFVLLFLTLIPIADSYGNSLFLVVGQKASIDLPFNGTIHVSHKGIIELTKNGESLLITAIRKGKVIISGDSNQDEQGSNLLVEVTQNPELKSSIAYQPICLEKDVECKNEKISGHTSDYHIWWEALSDCQRFSRCQFNLLLSREGRRGLHAWLANKLSLTESSIEIPDQDHFQKIVLTIECPIDRSGTRGKRVGDDELFPEGISSDNFEIKCIQIKTKQYRLILRVTQSRIEDETQRALKLGPLGDSLTTSLRVTGIDASNKQASATLLAQPELNTLIDAPFSLHSGGEVKDLDINEDGRALQTWKRFGVELKGTLRNQNHLVFDGTISLSEPSKGRSHASHKVNIATVLQKNEFTFIARSDLNHKTDSEFNPYYFDKIPIIGPLFRQKTSTDYESKIDFYIKAIESF